MEPTFSPSPVPEKKEEAQVVTTAKSFVNPKKHRGKIASAMLNPDIQDVGAWMIFDVVMPRATRFLADVLTSAINGILKVPFSSSSGSTNSIRASSPNIHVHDYTKSNTTSSRGSAVSASSVEQYSKMYWIDRKPAQDVKDELYRIFNAQGHVYVADLFRAAGRSCDESAYRWGWDDLTGTDVIFRSNVELHDDATGRDVVGGYYLLLPRARML